MNRRFRSILPLGLAFFFIVPNLAVGQSFRSLFSFDGTDGAVPVGLSKTTSGKLYGATSGGGTFSYGTIFDLTDKNTLYSFCEENGCPDGRNPTLPITQGPNGNLYGATVQGGIYGWGTIFEVTPSGKLTTQHAFCQLTDCADGASPGSGPTLGSDGNFYGTTSVGGAYNEGTFYELTPQGTLTTLYSFCAQRFCTDGSSPIAAPVQGADGNFYGTTFSGGNSYTGFCDFGCGVVYEITPGGVYKTVYSFCPMSSCAYGANPLGGLALGKDSNFYGTTFSGGAKGVGTVYKVTPAGDLTVLHSFCSETGCADGSALYSGLLLGSDGAFYGVTYDGGTGGAGTVFRITSDGSFSTLHAFVVSDGALPVGLMQETSGKLYGTTEYGGTSNEGTIFSLGK